jgi:hypothetical protein
MHLIELLGDMGHVESNFSPFGGSVLSVQDMCTVYAKQTIGLEIILVSCTVSRNIPQAQNSFRTHPMVLLGDDAQMEAHFSPSRDNVSVGAR